MKILSAHLFIRSIPSLRERPPRTGNGHGGGVLFTLIPRNLNKLPCQIEARILFADREISASSERAIKGGSGLRERNERFYSTAGGGQVRTARRPTRLKRYACSGFPFRLSTGAPPGPARIWDRRRHKKLPGLLPWF